MYLRSLTTAFVVLISANPTICEKFVTKGTESSKENYVYTGFNWSAITATPSLRYTPCYEGFECARLEVPLDWTNASNPYKVQLAIIRLPATVPETDDSFGGTILFNPGGPGGSGIDVMRWTGHGIRDVVDGEKHFEILSWDPRGMQHTTPPVSCFKDDYHRDVWLYRNQVVGPMDTSNASLIQKWALAESFGRICAQNTPDTYSDGSNIAQFTTTSLVARDMVAIIDQIEIHRAQALQPHGVAAQQEPIQPEKPALLNYWGYSYGSYLGNTFASMFPSRVGRMILDSVVDPDDYTRSGWLSNLQDNDKVLEYFYKDCFEAGRRCALNSLDFKSSADMAVQVGKMLDNLKHAPLVVIHDDIADIVTFADVSSFILATMYYPTWSWPEVASILADLFKGNGTSMVKHLPNPSVPMSNLDRDELGQQLLQRLNITNAYPPGYGSQVETAHSVLCGDGNDLTYLNINDWADRLTSWHAQSKIAGWKWSEIPLLCAHWPKSLRPAERNRFQGPWSSHLADYDPRASPLLFIGGTADPVLPTRNAYKAAASHEGARVLIQNGPGHCSGYINPSQCTWHHIKTFFAKGILPANNTICERDGTAWTIEPVV